MVIVVILNWNGRDDTLACLASVAKITYPNFNVIVVDNGSADDSVAAIHSAFPYIELIETGQNLGFAGGNNVGIKHALEQGADYVLLLNNDTEVDPGMLDGFVAAAKRFPDAGVFSAKIYFHAEPNRIWYAGACWNDQTARFNQVGEGELDDGQCFASACETDYACGCAFFVPAARLRELGLLDDDFFLYFEETDWCYRARKAGYASMFVPEAKLWHKVSVSFGGEGSPLALYFQTRNRLLWASRHAALPRRLAVYAAAVRTLWHRFVRPLLGARTGRWYSPKAWWWAMRMVWRDPSNRAYLMGFRDFWLRRFGDCPAAVRDLARAGSAKRLSALQGPDIRQSDDALLHSPLMPDPTMPPLPMTEYFRDDVLVKRPYIGLDWCAAAIEHPIRREIQPEDNRIRHWIFVPELDRYLRVVTLEDGVTLHNAFPDRRFKP